MRDNILCTQAYDPIDVGIRQLPQQHGVDDAEDRGIGADAERQSGHSDTGEAGPFPERAESEAHVLPHIAMLDEVPEWKDVSVRPAVEA